MSDYYDDAPLPLWGCEVAPKSGTSVIEPIKRPTEQFASEKRRAVLAILENGNISCRDLEITIHRGQAVVGELRNRGYQIDTRTIDGRSHYVYVGFMEVVRVTPTMKECYYRTSHWQETARRRKDIDNWRCVQCGSGESLHTHHWRYNLFAENVRLDLTTLCQDCHNSIHEAVAGSGIHFPCNITREALAKLIEEFPECSISKTP